VVEIERGVVLIGRNRKQKETEKREKVLMKLLSGKQVEISGINPGQKDFHKAKKMIKK
jgi:hypothetical protein